MSSAGPLRRTIPTGWRELRVRYEPSGYGRSVCRRTWPPNVDTETPQEVRHSIHAARRAVPTPVRASGVQTGTLRGHGPRGRAVRSSNTVYESALVQTPTRPEPLNVRSCASIRFVPSQYTST